MHGAMGGGTNGAGHVNMGLPYKAYNAEQVSAMQVMVVGVHTEMAGYEQVGTLMQGTAGAIEAAGMGPVMHLAIGGGNIRLPSVVRPTNALVMPPAYDNSFTEVQPRRMRRRTTCSAKSRRQSGPSKGCCCDRASRARTCGCVSRTSTWTFSAATRSLWATESP